ncbi:MAG: hypothetical protein ACTHOD_07555 [Motilibacteraceae bacterium]
MSSEQSGGRRVPGWVREWAFALAFGTIWYVLSHAVGLTAGESFLGAFVLGGAVGLVMAIARSRRRCDRG